MADLSTLKIKDFKLEPDSNGEYKYLMKKSNVDITFKFLTKKNELEIDKIRDSWNGNGVAPIITKQLEFMIKSVAGNKDPMNIRNFIERLPIKDSQDFRKYISENKPALDLIQKIMTPSGEEIQVEIGFGVEFFRPFYGI
jgi:predicted nucleotide-binding protein (sugar kinase/HSP70/actin superfamily)